MQKKFLSLFPDDPDPVAIRIHRRHFQNFVRQLIVSPLLGKTASALQRDRKFPGASGADRAE
jgi:hypothetical protein